MRAPIQTIALQLDFLLFAHRDDGNVELAARVELAIDLVRDVRFAPIPQPSFEPSVHPAQRTELSERPAVDRRIASGGQEWTSSAHSPS